MPHEGWVSLVCEAFGCPPDVAARQDPWEVQRILEYRACRDAAHLTRPGADPKAAFEVMREHPHLAEALAMMGRARADAPLDGGNLEAEGAALARARVGD